MFFRGVDSEQMFRFSFLPANLHVFFVISIYSFGGHSTTRWFLL